MTDNNSVFTDANSTLENYRSFSPFGFLSLIISLITGTMAVVNASLVSLAIIAAVWAAITLFILHRKQSMSGYGMATFALFIALFSATCSISYRHYRFAHLSQTAVDHSRTWLTMMQEGKEHEAYQLTLRVSKRRKPGTRLEEYYGTVDAPSADFNLFLQDEPEKSIREDGTNCSFVRGRMMYRKSHAKREDFIVRYTFKRADSSLPDREFDMIVRRQVHIEPYGVQWIIDGIANMNPRIPRKLTAEKRKGY